MNLPVTSAELEACKAKHREVLVHKIRECGRSEPPSDGAIMTIMNTLAMLEQVIPVDDPAGRGEGATE